MSYLSSPTFFLVVSFIAFLGLLYRYAWRLLIEGLDTYIAQVKDNFQQASTQKKQALLLFDEEAKFCEQLEGHIEEILKEARQQCDLLRHNIQMEVEAEALEQEVKLKLMIEKMKQDFLFQLNDQIANQIVAKVHQWTATHLQSAVQIASHQKAIDLLEKLEPFNHSN